MTPFKVFLRPALSVAREAVLSVRLRVFLGDEAVGEAGTPQVGGEIGWAGANRGSRPIDATMDRLFGLLSTMMAVVMDSS